MWISNMKKINIKTFDGQMKLLGYSTFLLPIITVIVYILERTSSIIWLQSTEFEMFNWSENLLITFFIIIIIIYLFLNLFIILYQKFNNIKKN